MIRSVFVGVITRLQGGETKLTKIKYILTLNQISDFQVS